MGEIRVNHCSGLWTLKSDVLLRTGETLKWHNRHLPILQQNHSGGACVAANLTAKPFGQCLCCCSSYSKTILAVLALLPALQQNHSGGACVLPILQQNHSGGACVAAHLTAKPFCTACVTAHLRAKPFCSCLCCCQSYSKTILAMSVLLPILQQNHSGDVCVAANLTAKPFW